MITDKNTKQDSTPGCGVELSLVAYDDRYAFYTDKECQSLTTIRRDKKKMNKRDKKEADRQIDFLFSKCDFGDC